jgi:hypothetical protein
MEKDLATWCVSVNHPLLLVAHTGSDGSGNQFKFWENFKHVSGHQSSKNIHTDVKEDHQISKNIDTDVKQDLYGCHSFTPTAHGKGTAAYALTNTHTHTHTPTRTHTHTHTYLHTSRPIIVLHALGNSDALGFVTKHGCNVLEKRCDLEATSGSVVSELPFTGLPDLARRLQKWRVENPGRGDPNARNYIHRHQFISVNPSTFPSTKYRFSANSLPATNHHYAGLPPQNSPLVCVFIYFLSFVITVISARVMATNTRRTG